MESYTKWKGNQVTKGLIELKLFVDYLNNVHV